MYDTKHMGRVFNNLVQSSTKLIVCSTHCTHANPMRQLFPEKTLEETKLRMQWK